MLVRLFDTVFLRWLALKCEGDVTVVDKRCPGRMGSPEVVMGAFFFFSLEGGGQKRDTKCE